MIGMGRQDVRGRWGTNVAVSGVLRRAAEETPKNGLGLRLEHCTDEEFTATEVHESK